MDQNNPQPKITAINGFPAFSQVDPRWANQILNKERFTKVGCLVTTLASLVSGMMTRQTGKAILIRPDTLDRLFDQGEVYWDRTDLVIWDDVAKVMRHDCNMKINSFFKVPLAESDFLKNGIGEHERPIILQVKTQHDSTHFILAPYKTWVMDPGVGVGKNFRQFAETGYKLMTIVRFT